MGLLIPGSSCSLSVPSEPPDLGNWFASYRYASSAMNSNSFHNEFGTGESESGKDEGNSCGFREIGNEVGVLVHEKADGVVKCGRSLQDRCLSKSEELAKHNTTSGHSKKPADQTTGLDENLSGQSDFCLKYKPNTLQNYRSSQPKHAETSSFNKGDSQCKVDQQTFHGTRSKPLNRRSSCSNDGTLVHSRGSTSQESSEAKVHAEEFLLETNSELISVNEASVSKTTHGSKARKDDGTGISEDGFITTRKRKFTARNDENFPEGPPRSSGGSVPSVRGKDVIERKTLADTTNFHHSPATMITGKWKCRQQRKPNLGPPLKQLGLEHWIRKS